MVQQEGKSLQLVGDEITRWTKILELPYREWPLAQQH